jgi:hypothetical protein
MKRSTWRWRGCPTYCRYCGRRITEESGFGCGGRYGGFHCLRSDCIAKQPGESRMLLKTRAIKIKESA